MIETRVEEILRNNFKCSVAYYKNYKNIFVINIEEYHKAYLLSVICFKNVISCLMLFKYSNNGTTHRYDFIISLDDVIKEINNGISA